MIIKEIIIRVVILLIFECFIWGSLEIGLKMDEREKCTLVIDNIPYSSWERKTVVPGRGGGELF